MHCTCTVVLFKVVSLDNICFLNDIFEKRKQLFGRIFTNWKDEAVNVKIPDTSVSLDGCLSVCLFVSQSVCQSGARLGVV
jgi:hypothetical protein